MSTRCLTQNWVFKQALLSRGKSVLRGAGPLPTLGDPLLSGLEICGPGTWLITPGFPATSPFWFFFRVPPRFSLDQSHFHFIRHAILFHRSNSSSFIIFILFCFIFYFYKRLFEPNWEQCQEARSQMLPSSSFNTSNFNLCQVYLCSSGSFKGSILVHFPGPIKFAQVLANACCSRR